MKSIRINTIILCSFLLMILVFSSCSNNDNLKEISEISEEMKSYKFTDTENLHFECTPILQKLDKIYTFTSKSPSDFNDDAEREEAIQRVVKYSEKFCGQKIDKTQVVADGSSYLYEEPDQLQITVSANKSFSIATRSYFDLLRKNSELGINVNGTDQSTHIIFNGKDESGKTYIIDGKDINVKTAAEYAQKWVKDNFSDMFDPVEDGVEISDSIAVKSSDGKYYSFHVRIASTVSGVRINENGFVDPDPNPSVTTNFIRPTYIDVEMSDEKTILCTTGMFRTVKTDKNEITMILPLSEAVKKAAEGLAPNLEFNVKDVRLKYCVHSTNKTNKGPNEYRPMWCFLLEVTEGNSFYSVVTKDLFVDAIDGTIYLSDSKQMTCEICNE